MLTITDYLKQNPYPGRGILLGLTPDGSQAVLAYFIMGRSENSRNRVFVESEDFKLKTEAHDPTKLTDPSLVIYTALSLLDNRVIVTNGDQTDTIHEILRQGGSFEQALHTRSYEPDSPHFTPRISGLITIVKNRLQYKLSILKKGNGEDCQRFFYDYMEPQPGESHIIHTYLGDGSPLPCFAGEPVSLATHNDIGSFTEELWAALDKDNRVALHVRYINIENYPVKQSRMLDRFNDN
ncbi:MAG: IMP cyclohydrolase [Clostridiales bacterium]|nr:IMP cyclohydrolase [Clostridiales bacterium]